MAQLIVRCDMKLHSILLGWMKVLTKPCVSPKGAQVERPQTSIAKLRGSHTKHPQDASGFIEQRVGSDETGLREA